MAPVSRPLGILVNPYSGRDARRLFARAGTSTHEDKRSQVTRIVVGAAAAGIEKIVLVRDAFRIASSAVEALSLSVDCELLDVETTGRSVDGERAAEALRDRGCGAVVALGGDGTSRAIARTWPEAPLLPVSTGTNNVFPFEVEATVAGAAAGLVAAARVPLEDAARRAKCARVRCADGRASMALVDAALLIDDHLGSLLQADPAKLGRVLLARAEPASVGLSPVGGLLCPCGAADEFGVEVVTRTGPGEAEAPSAAGGHGHEHGHARGPGHAQDPSGKTLRAPLSPGLYETVRIEAFRRVGLGEPIRWTGPGVLAFDGDREIELGAGEAAELAVERTGPWVIDPQHVLRQAAERGLFVDLGPWHDPRSGTGRSADPDGGGSTCC